MSKATGRPWMVLGVLAAGLIGTALAQAQDATDTSQGQLVPLNPCRVFDTRRPNNPGPLVTDTLVPGGSTATRYFTVRGSCGIPRDVQKSEALAYNLTVPGTFNQQPFDGHMLVFPSDLTQVPLASSINFPPNFTIANAAIIRLNPCPDWDAPTTNTTTSCHVRRPGDIAIHVFLRNGADGTSSLGTTVHTVLDVTGYFRR